MNFYPVARNFDLGFQSDVSRDELAQNAAFRLKDYIPQLEAPVRKRGGWSYGSPDLGSLGGTAASAASLGYLPFAADGHLVVVSNAGSVYQVKRFDGLGGALVTDTGDASIVPTWPIFWHKTGTKSYGIILPGLGQVHKVPKKYFDTTGGLVYQSQPLGGTPPQARSGFSWGDYLVLLNYFDPTGGVFDLKNYRMAFSAVGDPDTWTLSGVSASTFDFPEEIIAGIPVRNAILVWGYNNCHILTGDTPPPGGNLSRKILFAGNGTFDGRSCIAWRDFAVWANASGIWKSDGATLTDVTAAAGISVYYRQLVTGFAFTQGWSASAGIYRDHYVLTIRNAAGAVVSTVVIDLTRNVPVEWTNIPAGLFAVRPAGPGTALFGGDEELFFAHISSPRVGKISSLWTPSATFASDGDGTAVLPVIETPFYVMQAAQLKRVRAMYATYDIRTAGGSPALRVSAVYTAEPGAAYTQLTPDLPTTTKMKRKYVRVAQAAQGIGLKIQQINPSADTRLYGLEVEGFPLTVTH